MSNLFGICFGRRCLEQVCRRKQQLPQVCKLICDHDRGEFINQRTAHRCKIIVFKKNRGMKAVLNI